MDRWTYVIHTRLRVHHSWTLDVKNTMVKEMKAGALDGKLTPSEKKAIKAAAVASVKGQLGKVFLEKAFGTTGAPLHDSVSAAVEGELASFKRMERAAAAANPTGLF